MKLPASLALLAATALGPSACSSPPPPAASDTLAESTMSPVERGEYLVTAGACSDCHTPKKMGPTGPVLDTDRMLSGHPEDVKVTMPTLSDGWVAATNATETAWAGPWGISFTANLTPDATGIGTWTEDMFIQAMRTGKHMGVTRPILPPMPWQSIARYTDDDLKAMFAYLKSIRPVVNHVPSPIPPPGAPRG
jgi:mono/diheme cytochrome c family protein